ncbi:hypothetical protein CO731_04452 [Aminobacter sp. MSH1]|nr:hypothetical protein CO731_04452 [Aminobacter sp. MSH1]
MIYHFTDTARLPWILHDGELQPGRCRVGGFPDPDFLWATASLVGDRTASAGVGGFRDGLVRLVRITLHPEDFTPWRVASEQHPDWTEDHIARLEAAAIRAGSSQADIAGWYCRSSSIPTDRLVAVETRSWSNKSWKPFPLAADCVIYARQDHKVAAGIAIEGVRYFSERVEHPSDGRRGYATFRAE